MTRPKHADLLRTDRLELRPAAPEDAAELHAIFLEPDVRRYLLDDSEVDRAWVDEIIADSAASFRERGLGLWVARATGTPSILGLTGYREFYDPPVLELIYLLRTSAFGRGYATEMARAALQRGFERGLAEVRASTDAPNEASLAVMKRLGLCYHSREPGEPHEQVHYVLARRDGSGATG